MGCFSCFRSSRGSRKSCKCWKGKSPNEGETTRKRKRRGSTCCFCGGRSPKDEESSENKGSTCCFICHKSSKDAKNEEPTRKRSKCGMGCLICDKSSDDEEPLRKKGRCGVGCFACGKSSEDEGSSGKKGKSSKGEESSEKSGKCGMSCFIRNNTSEEEEPSRKRSKCGMCCFRRGGSSKDAARKREQGCRSCFCCFKPSKEDLNEAKGRVGPKVSKRKKSCFSCFRSSKKQEPRKEGDKATGSSSDAKRKCSGCMIRVCGCSHCCSSRNKNANRPRGKKMFCWKRKAKKEINHLASLVRTISFESESRKKRSQAEEILRIGNGNIAARVFAYHDLVEATQNFAPECLLGKGGFGKVYKGELKDSNQLVAVKKLDRNGYQGNREFLIEVLMLSLLSHQNLVNLLGYCADGAERILVYDYMSLGSLQDHLFDLSPNSKPLDWNTRMKIAAGAAKGLEHLHDKASPPVIYRDLKASNILLDEDYNPRLADFGLAKLGPVGDKQHVSTRVMGTYGYCAPEYALTGKLTTKTDIYSFGVVLLELVTGKKAMDSTRPRNEQRLVDWAAPRFQDKKNFVQLADPRLHGNFPVKALYQALAIAAMCLQEEETARPLIKDVVFALQFLAMPEKSSDTVSKLFTQLPQKEVSCTSKDADEESLHDWQSCSAEAEGQEEEEEKLIKQGASVAKENEMRKMQNQELRK